MPKIVFKAVEMTDANVQRISLVERSASRMPIRITKQEKPMRNPLVDLASVLKREKPAAPVQIVGVVTMKSEATPQVTSEIASAGFATDKMSELEDGSVVFAQSDDLSGESAVVRVSDHTALVVKGLRPYSMDITLADGTSFAEVCKAQGFYPGVGTMLDVLRSSVLTLAEKSDNPADAATSISKMFDEAKQYAVGLVRDLPAKAFKLEFVAPEVVAADPAMKSESGESQPEADGKADDGEGQSAAPDSAPAAAASNTPDPASVQKSETDEVVKALKGQIESIGSSVQGMVDAMKGVTDTLSALSTRVGEVENVAKAAREAVEGTVTSGPAGSDPHQITRKSDVSRGREIDTGWTRRPTRTR